MESVRGQECENVDDSEARNGAVACPADYKKAVPYRFYFSCVQVKRIQIPDEYRQSNISELNLLKYQSVTQRNSQTKSDTGEVSFLSSLSHRKEYEKLYIHTYVYHTHIYYLHIFYTPPHTHHITESSNAMLLGFEIKGTQINPRGEY